MPYLTIVPTWEVGTGRKRTANDHHRAVMSLFPQKDATDPRSAREQFGVLFRVEPSPAGERYLIRSLVPPTPTRSSKTKQVSGDGGEVGRRVAFTATLNTVARHEGRAVGLPEELAVLHQWVTDKLADALDVDRVELVKRDVYPSGRKGGGSIQLDTVIGAATITDPDALAKMQAEGVGRAKALGGGLLLTKPLAA